ncbi:hypothetical protein SLS62_002006 [Diatrype stigma]|uniref:FAD-binding domain-containing protein n=1 Tax=Diatrype stigma TaxID=117547 RepID=A0AAN9YRB2_9PEZI
MSSQPRIAIVGGGPAGLTMGVLLHQRQIPFTIFELRQEPSEEELAKPSGMLDLHEGSGLAAIRECGLYDQFVPLTGDCTEDRSIADKSGNIILKLGGGEAGRGTRPEISRNNLTKLLLGKVPKDSIKWGHKLLSATATRPATSDHRVETELDFGTHGTHRFDLVVGADGAWSRVRPLLTDVKPYFTGMQIIAITFQGITTKYPHLAEFVGPGSFSALGNKHSVGSQRGPSDSIRIYIWLTQPDENFATNSGLAGMPATSAKDKLLQDDALLDTFGTPVKDLVATACDEESANNPGASLDVRALYSLPHGTSWEHRHGVTIVGDAAHLMLPNGEGVNISMLDSLLLSQAIIKAYETAEEGTDSFQSIFDPLLKEFEADLVERAKKAGKDTDIIIDKMFGSDEAAYDLVRFFESVIQERAGKH